MTFWDSSFDNCAKLFSGLYRFNASSKVQYVSVCLFSLYVCLFVYNCILLR